MPDDETPEPPKPAPAPAPKPEPAAQDSDLPAQRKLSVEMTDNERPRTNSTGDIDLTALADGRVKATHKPTGRVGIGASAGQAIDDLQPPPVKDH